MALKKIRAAVSKTFGWLSESKFTGPALIFLAAGLAWIPYFVRGMSCGHDFDFHFESWYEIARGWKSGVLYPHWAESPNWGAGEPRFVFYPPVTWVLGAALGVVFGWGLATPMLIWMLLAATGLSVRALAREWFGDGTATLAGAIAIFSGYTMFNAFERSAFSELASGALIPLVALFALRQKNAASGKLAAKIFDGSTLPLALTIAAVWLTNAPAAVMACYLLAFVAAIAAWVERDWWPVARAVIALADGMMAAAIYILPAAYEQRWIDIAQAIGAGMRVEDSWLFAKHAASDMAFHAEVLWAASVILVVMIAATLVGFAIALARGQLERVTRRGLMVLAAIPAVVLVMQFPFADFVWRHLPKLDFLQFPWRLLLLVEAPMAIFLAAASVAARRWLRVLIVGGWALIFLMVTAGSGLVFSQTCDEDDSIGGQIASISSGLGVEGTDEYTPKSADNALVATSLPDACLVSDPMTKLGDGAADTTPAWDQEQGTCDATFTAAAWRGEHKRMTAVTDDDGTLILRLRAYPAWRVMLNGKPVENLVRRDDGLIAIPVSEGTNEIAIDWMTTRDVFWGRILSVMSLPILTGMWWMERRKRGNAVASQVITTM